MSGAEKFLVPARYCSKAGDVTALHPALQPGDTGRYDHLQVICINATLLQRTAVLRGDFGVASRDTTQPHGICQLPASEGKL